MSYPVLSSPPDAIAVPTHFFKVVLGEKRGGEGFATAGFILPNKVIPENKDLRDFQAPLDVIEKQAGLIFFDKVSLLFAHYCLSLYLVIFSNASAIQLDGVNKVDLCRENTCTLAAAYRRASSVDSQ